MGKVPVRGRFEESQLDIGGEDEDRLGILDLESFQRKFGERVAGVRWKVPLLESGSSRGGWPTD